MLRNALEHAMREDLVVRNAAKLVRIPTPPRRGGHSQIAVTMNVYTHVTSAEQRQAMKLLAEPESADEG